MAAVLLLYKDSEEYRQAGEGVPQASVTELIERLNRTIFLLLSLSNELKAKGS